MRRDFAHLALAFAVPAFLLAIPASAQENRGAASSGSAGGGAAARGDGGGGGGGGSAASGGGGGSASGGASTGGGSSSGGGWMGGTGGGAIRSDSGGGHYGATGSSGRAISHGEDRGNRSGGSGEHNGGSAVSRGTSSKSGSGGSGSDAAGGGATARRGEGERVPRTLDGEPQYSRPRGDRDPVGTAVPRGSVPTTDRNNGGLVFIPAGYYGGYYPGGYGYYGDPYGYSGGYYGGYYDPWYGAYPSSGQTYSSAGEEGALRLKIKPKEAEVYVDGYYVGIVDEFDGVFQKLHIETGAHRIEIRAPGYEPLTFDVRIAADHKTTYEGELKRIP
jgi:hypothetical protein